MPEPTIDPTTFATLGDMAGAAFVSELIDTFLAEAPGMLADLRDAHATRDAERFRRAAHSLKSNSDTFGAQRLGAVARGIEAAGVDATSTETLAVLDTEYVRAAAALEALRDA